MLRLEHSQSDRGGGGGRGAVVRLEHLPDFTERATPAALTPEILGQARHGKTELLAVPQNSD
ncbi:unnamed protein product [Discosporangium mesarthrocarpum]